MAENFANEYQTALDGAIDDSVTSIDVLSALGAPATRFRIRIDDEYLLVTAKSGATFTVTRGIEGSTPASHVDGALVTHIVTAGGLQDVARFAQLYLPLHTGGTAAITAPVNSTSYITTARYLCYADFDHIPWTHFSIQLWGGANAAGQTITLEVRSDMGNGALSATGNDLVITNPSAHFVSGWIPISNSITGMHRLALAMKGSNTTVDLTFEHLSISLKYDP